MTVNLPFTSAVVWGNEMPIDLTVSTVALHTDPVQSRPSLHCYYMLVVKQTV